MKDENIAFLSLALIVIGMAITLIAVITAPIVILMYAAKVLFL